VAGTRIASISGLRGIVGDGLDPALALEYAAAYASTRSPSQGKARAQILVAHDGRPTALTFQNAVVAGVLASGCNALIAGALATPTVGFEVARRRLSGAVQVSASHNPPEYNGLKMFQPGGMVLSPLAGREVFDRFQARRFTWAAWNALGYVEELSNAHQPHLERILEVTALDPVRRRGFKVVLDAGHGAGGRLGGELLRELGCDVLVIGGEPDGRYEHLPEPTEANLKSLTAIVPAVGADLGFAQDPDADRLAIVDETGRYIGEELTLALAGLHRLGQDRGPVVINLSTSRTVEEIAKRAGCPVHRTPVGEIHVVEEMVSARAVLGGEGNGGVIDPRVGFVRDSFVGMALVLELLASSAEPLSRVVRHLPQFEMIKMKYPLGEGPPVAELFDRLAQAHPDARADRRDGLRLDWPGCWAHIRPSNTEPIVRVIAEAEDRARAEELADFLGRWVVSGGAP
jgi:phosphomannomutase